MNNKISIVFGLLIGLLVGGGSVYLKLYHQVATTPTHPTPITTPTPPPNTPPAGTGSPATETPLLFPPTGVTGPFAGQDPSTPGATKPAPTGTPSDPSAKPSPAAPGQSTPAHPADESPIQGVHFDQAQNTQFDAIRSDVQHQLAALDANTKLNDSEKRARALEVYKQADARVISMLTPAQRRVLKAQQEKEKQELARQQQSQQQQRAAAIEAAGQDDPLSGIHLTAEQKAHVEAIHASALKQSILVLQNSKINKEGQDMQLRAITELEMKKIRDIISPEPPRKEQPAGPVRPSPVPAPVKMPAPGFSMPAPTK